MSAEEQAIVDREHLKLLSLFHYISGGMTTAFAALFGVWFAFISVIFSALPAQSAAACNTGAEKCAPGAEAMEFMPGIILTFFGIFLAIFLALGVLDILTGWFISKHRHRVFSIVVSIPGLLFIPYGTLLSVFTIIVLERPSVKALFEK